jgi:predicted transcriptional regulator
MAVILERHLLRHAVLVVLMRRRATTMTVAEIVAELGRRGFVFARSPSRAVSDSLRVEVREGRVERVGRGRYRVREVGEGHRRYVERVVAELGRQPRHRHAVGSWRHGRGHPRETDPQASGAPLPWWAA